MIDEKGRIHIFKFKINTIDFLVVIFLICLLPIFFFGYKLTKRPVEAEPAPATIKIDKAKHEKDKARLKKLDNWLKENKKMSEYFK